MKSSYRMSIGYTYQQLQRDHAEKLERNNKDKELFNKYIEKMSLELFLEIFEKKQYGLHNLSRLINKYLSIEPVTSDNVRLRVIRCLT